MSLLRSSASGLAIGVAYPRRRRPERIRSASSRSRSRSTGIIREGRGLARGVRRISRSGGVSSGGSGQLLRGWATAQDGRAPRRSSRGTARPAGGPSRCGFVRQAGFQRRFRSSGGPAGGRSRCHGRVHRHHSCRTSLRLPPRSKSSRRVEENGRRAIASVAHRTCAPRTTSRGRSERRRERYLLMPLCVQRSNTSTQLLGHAPSQGIVPALTRSRIA